MEGNETPKVNSETVSPNVPSAENKELSIKAAELAKVTRERGMGILYGSFLDKRGGTKGYEMKGYFIQGEDVRDDSYMHGPIDGKLIDMSSPLQDFNIRSELEAWAKSNYQVPMEIKVKSVVVKVPQTRQIKEKKFFGLKTSIRVESYTSEKTENKEFWTNNPRTYKGKRGNFDWIQYDYLMHIVAGGRDGMGVMSIAVPPDIARQIDEQVENNVYFPDAFFKALYPNFQPNTDAEFRLNKTEAKGLRVIDLIKDPYNPKTDLMNQKGKLRPYPNL